MNGLESIPIRVEGGLQGPQRTDNLEPILRQVGQALRDLVDSESTTLIDLAAMPFSKQDESDLRALLGRGEVSATVEAFGPTLIAETAFPGVWLVEHQDAEQRRLTLHIEVARVPAILLTPEEDLAESLAALEQIRPNSSDAFTEEVQ